MVIEKEVIVSRPDGLHARPAGELIKLMKAFQCTVEIQFDGKKVDAKSIIQLMGLVAKQGDKLYIVIKGDDAEAALSSLERFLNGTDE